MIDEHDPDREEEIGEPLELELNAQGQIFLDMRQQNLDLLEIAARVAGYGGEHAPLKSSDLRGAMKNIWEVYSEFYSWVDPEESDDDEEGEE